MVPSDYDLDDIRHVPEHLKLTRQVVEHKVLELFDKVPGEVQKCLTELERDGWMSQNVLPGLVLILVRPYIYKVDREGE